ncbi:MAG: radical SAM family heme chaperone HemW [Prevotella sp.]|nr:radical SAM family heme chaperone HemW [Prevotella sp.]
MAGLYIHIPFCRSRCIYCGFYSTTALDLRQRYVEALCKEMALRPSDEQEIETIYLGGGTPSQLTIPQLHQIFESLSIYNKVSPDAEVTIEMNPDDVTEAFADGLCWLPVNRVSMGAQTFDDERLKWLHRRHTSRQVAEALERLRDNGIQNISIDMMYGFPGETLDDWQADITAALSLNAEHLSAYCLMIEEGTPLAQMHQEGSGEELERSMYERLIDRLASAGYKHYEISNFAKPGFRSRHNSSYWNDTPYIGLGAAAHSYDGHTRSWNIADIRQYIEGMESGKRLFDAETIEGDTRYNDRLTVALRTREGLDLSTLSDRHRDYAIKNARRFLNDGLLHITPANHLALTRRGLFVSDMIISELMLV